MKQTFDYTVFEKIDESLPKTPMAAIRQILSASKRSKIIFRTFEKDSIYFESPKIINNFG